MIGNTVLWLSLCWMPILMYVTLANETKFKKNIAIGVTLPFEARRHPEVVSRLEQFKKEEKIICAALMLLFSPGMFLSFSMSFSLWFVWMTAAVIVPYIPYVQCNRDLKQLKVTHGWKRPSAADTVTVDMSAMPDSKWLSPWLFVPALVLSLVPMLFDRAYSFMYIIDAVMVVLCWLGYRYLYRNKAEMVDANSTVTAALSRIRRIQWGKMWLLCAYSMAAMNWLAWLTMYSPTAMTIGLVVFMVVLVGAAIVIEFGTRRLQETLTADSGKDFYVDDDDKWLYGLFYYNPNDDRLVINERVGTNSSVNLAKPAGKILYALIALVILTLPLWGLLLGNGEINTDIQSDKVLIEGGMHEYEIMAEDVLHIELLEELPPVTRTAGTGMPEFLGGNFASKEYGKLKVCLNPTAPPFVLVETEDTTYLLGTNEPAQTQAIYNALK